MTEIYGRIFAKLDELGILKVEEYEKREVPGFMPLSIDRTGSNRFALAHNYVQNGDLMADPDMEIRVDRKNKVAEALNFTQHNLGIYRQVYIDGKVDVKAKRELNQFLDQWLTNLINQGFGQEGN